MHFVLRFRQNTNIVWNAIDVLRRPCCDPDGPSLGLRLQRLLICGRLTTVSCVLRSHMTVADS